jgi:predicted nuclease of predicted toxin-antitoxin system
VKALLDEHLSPQIALLLRKDRYDVVAVACRDDLIRHSDRRIFEAACRDDRAVVTNNIKDFRPLAAEWLAGGRTHPGLVLLPSARTRTRSAVPALAGAIASVLRENPDGLSGSERWIGRLAT